MNCASFTWENIPTSFIPRLWAVVYTTLLISNLRVFPVVQYTSPVQGLSGKRWNSSVSDSEAAALLRADPNFVQGSLTDSDEATAQTVRYMSSLVKHSLSDPIIGQAWQDAWDRFHAIAFDDEVACAWWYAKYLIKFVHHQELLRDWLFSLDDLQLLISPEALLKMVNPKGDCAIFTTLIQALLSYRGIPWETVTVAVSPLAPDLYTHVYAQAIRPDGSRMPLDASHGKYPGWEAPPSRVFKKKLGTPTATKSQTQAQALGVN
jgi:hypothetical protein